MNEQSSAFELLAEPVQKWIWAKGWTGLRDIQEKATPVLLQQSDDLIIAASTAGGKTESAFLPLISSVLDNPSNQFGFDLVYVGPLRALINDQFKRLDDLCEKTEIPVHPWHGDISASIKKQARTNPRGILLITPESLEALFVLSGLEIPGLFHNTRAIVIDELHAFLDNERGIHMRSLLNRMEIAVKRRIRRVGLSATIGEMSLAREFLRPLSPEQVQVIEGRKGVQSLSVQIRGYCNRRDSDSDEEDSSTSSIVEHLFDNLRGGSNLIFAESRRNVELYSDALRELSLERRLPEEFFPHHSNLFREHRTELERRLKSKQPVTAVCTSTLELGIDIGNIDSVVQIGPPFSVASLRQRLGRSGRREGRDAVLRMYVVEREADSRSHSLDRLHLRLIRSIAMLELLINHWCEPPSTDALHLSTLTHQILSVIAEHNGAHPVSLYQTLCESGPFHRVSRKLFVEVLRHLGKPAVALIEQSPDGILLLGEKGEKLVAHYSFYAVFQTPVEYRIVAHGKELGTLPIAHLIVSDMTIIFSGRRWKVIQVDDKHSVIEVTEDRTGTPPKFRGSGGLIHDQVVGKMKEVLTRSDLPLYLSKGAVELLQKARIEFERLGFPEKRIHKESKNSVLIATWKGTVKSSTLALALQARGYRTSVFDGFVEVRNIRDIRGELERLAALTDVRVEQLIKVDNNLQSEKYHKFLSHKLLIQDVESSRLNLESLPDLTREILEVEKRNADSTSN